jgi:hypothetical protein
MAYTKIIYRSMVGNGSPGEYPQTPDQAALAIGINYVVGYRVEREETRTEEGQPLTTVSVFGSTEETESVMFGQYLFYGRM